jgi:hypothetical protein
MLWLGIFAGDEPGFRSGECGGGSSGSVAREGVYCLSKIVVIRPNRCSTFENCVDNVFVDEKGPTEFELVRYVRRTGWEGGSLICSRAGYVIVVQRYKPDLRGSETSTLYRPPVHHLPQFSTPANHLQSVGNYLFLWKPFRRPFP